MPELQPDGSTIDVGTMRLRTPGISGSVEIIRPVEGGARLTGLEPGRIDRALQRAKVDPLDSIEISVLDNTNSVGGAGIISTRRSDFEPTIELEVPNRGANIAQVVLAIDEQGLVTWNFPITREGDPDSMRGGGDLLFQIRATSPDPSIGTPGTRGVVGTIGKKILRVIAFPLLEAGTRLIADDVAANWEGRNRKYNLRGFSPGSHTRSTSVPLDRESLARLGEGPVLLLLHGTFSRAHSAFGRLPASDLHTLHQRYHGRVIAFDHFTLAHDPIQNLNVFLQGLPDGISLEVDILSHSRGGLVGRTLAEMQSELNSGRRSVHVRRHVFIASPNGGTVLTDTRHLGDLIDSYTNILQFLPTNGVTETLDAIINVVKHLAAGAVDGLPGLQAMRPGGPYLQRLNRPSGASPDYKALTANYEPTQPGLREWARDRLLDRIFQGENDLVVPTGGVWQDNGSDLFAIREHRVFDANAGIWHSGFLQNRDARQQILDWLPG